MKLMALTRLGRGDDVVNWARQHVEELQLELMHISANTAGSLPPGIIFVGSAAGGDLSGTYPNPSVVDDSHNHTAATLPPTIVYDGDPAGGDLTGTYPNPTLASVIVAGGPIGGPVTIPVITWDAKGRLLVVSTATIVGPFPPSGPAGGDLTGTYPNPTLNATQNANARVQVSKNSGATIGTRREINFIEGANITLTIADDAGNEEVDVTIAATGGGGGGSGTVTSVAGGVGITNTPEPIIATGTVDLDINSLTTEPAPVSGDLFAFVDVSVGTAPSAQRKATLANIAASPPFAALFQPLDLDLTEIAAVANVRGDLLVTNSGPTWVRLGIGTANTFLGSNGTDAAWAQVAYSQLTGVPATFPATPHSLTGPEHADVFNYGMAGTPQGSMLYFDSSTTNKWVTIVGINPGRILFMQDSSGIPTPIWSDADPIGDIASFTNTVLGIKFTLSPSGVTPGVYGGSNKTVTLTIDSKGRTTAASDHVLVFSDIGGSVTDAQVPDTITIANITQVTTRLHSSLQNLVAPADDHTQYLHLPGRAGGQIGYGGTGAGDDLDFRPTTHATPGEIRLNEGVTNAGAVQPCGAFVNKPSLNFDNILSQYQGILLGADNAGSATWTIATDLGSIFGAGGVGLNFKPTIRNAGVTAIGNMGVWALFGNLATWTANGAACSLPGVRSLIHTPSYNITAGGTLAVASDAAIYSAPAVGAGATLALRRSVHHDVSQGVGIPVVDICVDVAALIGTTSIAVRSAITSSSTKHFLQDTGGADSTFIGSQVQLYSPTSQVVPTENFVIHGGVMKLTGSQTFTLQGTSQLIMIGVM